MTLLYYIFNVFKWQVLNLENLATADPHNNLWPQDGVYMAEHSYVCRYVVNTDTLINNFNAFKNIFVWKLIYSIGHFLRNAMGGILFSLIFDI